MRKANVRFLTWLAGISVAALVLVYFVHNWQVHRHAGLYLEKATEAAAAADVTQDPDAVAQHMEEARDHYQRYLSLNPTDVQAREDYGNLLAKYGQWTINAAFLKGAFDQFENVLRKEPDRVKTRERQVEMAMAIGRFSDAEAHLAFLIKGDRAEDSELLEKRGLCQVRQEGEKKNMDAADSFLLAMKHASERKIEARVGPYMRMATLIRGPMADESFRGERLARMAQQNPKVAELGPDAPNSQLARAFVDRMVELDPQEPLVYLLRARYLLDDDALREDQTVARGRPEAEGRASTENQAAIRVRETFEQAAADCDKILELSPDDLDGLLMAAKCAHQLATFHVGDPAETQYLATAAELLNRGIALDSHQAVWYLQLSQIEIQSKRQEAAIQVVRNGLNLLPENWDLKWMLTNLLIGTEGANEEVWNLLADLTDPTDGRPDDPRAAYLTGRQWIAEQNWLEAKNTLESCRDKLAEFGEFHSKANIMLGMCHENLGNQDEQLATYRRALALSPTDVTARLGVARALMALGRSAEAEAEYQQVVDMQTLPTAATLTQLVSLRFVGYLRKGTPVAEWGSQLKQEILNIRRVYPAEPVLYLLEAEVLRAEEKQAEADKALKKPIDDALAAVAGRCVMDALHGPIACCARAAELVAEYQVQQRLFSLWSARVALAAQQDDYQKANQLLDQAQVVYGDTVEMRLARAGNLVREGAVRRPSEDVAPELAQFAQDTDKFSDDQRLQLNYGLATQCQLAGDMALAVKYGLAATDLAPKNLRLRVMVLDMATRIASPDLKTIERLTDEIDLVENGPKPLDANGNATDRPDGDCGPMTLCCRAVLLINQQKANPDAPQVSAWLDDARTKLTLASNLRPGWSRPPLLIGQIESIQGNNRDAIERFAEAIDLGERNPQIIQLVSSWKYYEGDYNGASSVFQKMEERQTEMNPTIGRLGSEISYELRDLNRAELMAVRAAAAPTAEYDDQWWCAEVLRVNGKSDRAEQYYDKAIAMATKPLIEGKANPYVAKIRFLLSRNTNEDRQAAAALIEKIKTDVDPVDQATTLAQCYTLRNQPGLAEQALAVALKESPDSPNLLATAAQHYLESRQYDTARKYLEKLLEAPLSDAMRNQTRRNLAIVQGADGTYAGFQSALELLDQNLADELAKAKITNVTVTDYAQVIDRLEKKGSSSGTSEKDLRVVARLFAARNLRSARNQAIVILQKLDGWRQGLEIEDRFQLAQLHLANGDWRQANDELMTVMLAAADAASFPRYVDFFVRNKIQQEGTPDRTFIGILKKKYPKRLDTVILDARNLLASTVPEHVKALKVLRDAVEDPEVLGLVPPAGMTDGTGSSNGGTENTDGGTENTASGTENTASGTESTDGGTGSTDGGTENTASGTEATFAEQNKQVKRARVALAVEEFVGQLEQVFAADKEQLAAVVAPYQQTLEEYYKLIIGDDPKLQLLRVPFLVRQKRAKEALAVTTQYWQATDVSTLTTACNSLLQRGNLSESEAREVEGVLIKALQALEGPQRVPVLSTLANYFVQNGRYDEAVGMYANVLKLRPTDIVALNNRAMIMAWQGEKLGEALKMVDQAISLVGPVPTLVDSRSVIKLARKEPLGALRDAELAVAEEPEKPDYWFHKALAHQAAGDRNAARTALHQATKLGASEQDMFELERDAWRKLVAWTQ